MISFIRILKGLVLVIILTVTCECQKFLKYSDFKNADKLTAQEIDRGVGIIDTKAEFNAKLFGGDIVKPPTKRKDVHGYITKSSGLHWPNGRVPYEFGSQFDSGERMHIAKAIQQLHQRTCIRIVPRNKSDRNYIRFIKGNGCYSWIGRQGNSPQDLSLGRGCVKADTIIHELMHALGFMHEFSRPDRDQHIRVKFENIDEGAKTQFRVLDGLYFGDWKLPFDVKSVMFYENGAAARRPGLDTMIAKNRQRLRCQPHECPTKLDTDKINTVYSCKPKKGREMKGQSGKRKAKKIFGRRKARKRYFRGQEFAKNVSKACDTLLKWKSSDEFRADIDNAVKAENLGRFSGYVCRTEFNGLVISGLTSRHGCRGSIFSGFPLLLKKYEVLVNPNGLKLEWSRNSTAPINAIIAGKGSNGVSYVMRCSYGDRRFCSSKEFLTCQY